MDPNLAAAFKLQLWPKAKRPSDAKGGGKAADQGRQAAGPSEQRALKRSARRRREAPKNK
ncbi:hypothetical protein SGRA_3726 [Saprospira grandis str. Lewin]|uniref:Uncharacterized protein n=1 Tax=Saprospira grandis (strain Lewin) TaxID=984262 RepID=H6L878_SAPGL|nr:hypothetical protein SGRA_3726 [Saprospira grandis str. Lewin]